MITNILTYIGSYDNVRAACGLDLLELPDATLALAIFKHKLGLKLESVSGPYPTSAENKTLQELFDDEEMADTDPMYAAIQLYAIYTTADAVLDAVGMRAYKTLSDGKSLKTRFSPESTFKDTKMAIRENISYALATIHGLFDETEANANYLSVVSPSVDLVVGEE